MNNTEKLQKEVLDLMDHSSMSADERIAWQVLIPNMLTEELEGFRKILLKEYETLKKIAEKNN